MECQTAPTTTTCSSKRVQLSQNSVENSKDDIHSRVRKILEKEYIGYVLVTCRKEETGEQAGLMEVQLSHEGDPVLTSYLADSTQRYFEEHVVLEE